MRRTSGGVAEELVRGPAIPPAGSDDSDVPPIGTALCQGRRSHVRRGPDTLARPGRKVLWIVPASVRDRLRTETVRTVFSDSPLTQEVLALIRAEGFRHNSNDTDLTRPVLWRQEPSRTIRGGTGPDG